LGVLSIFYLFESGETKTPRRDVFLGKEMLTFEFFETLESSYNFDKIIIIESP
jgi:hypothetical protein